MLFGREINNELTSDPTPSIPPTQEIAIIESRYAKGQGQAPLHLALIHSATDESGYLQLVDKAGAEHRVLFSSHAERLSLLTRLIRERVPMAVGGMCPGPADEVALLIANKALNSPFIELSWTAPQQWIVREIAGNTVGWVAESDVASIANTSFDPGFLTGSE